MASELVKKAAIGGLVFMVLLILLLVLVNFLSGKHTGSINVGEGQKLETDDNGRIVVPLDRIPSTFSERETAPAITLLPEHSSVTTDPVPTTTSDSAQIRKVAASFLQAWETFDPRKLTGAEQAHKANPYNLRLQPYVVPESIGDIRTRIDSNEAPGVCPTCITGSHWVPSDIGASLQIKDYNESQAYVTVTGLVTYTGDPRFNQLAGITYYRSYALLMQKQGNDWLVDRAVAETLSPAHIP